MFGWWFCWMICGFRIFLYWSWWIQMQHVLFQFSKQPKRKSINLQSWWMITFFGWSKFKKKLGKLLAGMQGFTYLATLFTSQALKGEEFFLEFLVTPCCIIFIGMYLNWIKFGEIKFCDPKNCRRNDQVMSTETLSNRFS